MVFNAAFIAKMKLKSRISHLPYCRGEIYSDFFTAEINGVKYMKCVPREPTKAFAYRMGKFYKI
jgi:hypothetical protein